MKIILVAGARPNFMKIAPIIRALDAKKSPNLCYKLVHTGQHYDYNMSDTFLDDLYIGKPDYFLKIGSDSHGRQTAKIMTEFERVCIKERPNMVLVVGDVNSTLACAIVAKKLVVDLAHVEAGLRSFDRRMPEEINRIATDSITDYFFTTEKSANYNLLKEGKPDSAIHFVGNVMIDNLLFQKKKLEYEDKERFVFCELKKKLGNYIFLTLHRPENVDDFDVLSEIVFALNIIADDMPIIFPIHPRTKKSLKQFDITLSQQIHTLDPLGFKESLFLLKDAMLVLTDSGGIQEETTGLGIPCFTLRDNTERPVTIEEGTNILVGNRRENILVEYEKFETSGGKKGMIPKYWDGNAAKRTVDILEKILKKGEI